MPDIDHVFDRTAVIAALDGDLDLYGEISRLFLAHYADELNALRQALAAGDPAALHHAAHSLKGTVSNFAAPHAVETARAVEFAHKAREQVADNADAMVADTIAAVEALAAAMRTDLEANGLA